MRSVCPIVENQKMFQRAYFKDAAIDDQNEKDCLIFELDSYGTILFCCTHPCETGNPALASAAGTNLFEDIAGFKDIQGIKKRFKEFLENKNSRDVFLTECGSAECPIQAKVCLTRTFQTGNAYSLPLIMMEIKGEENGHFINSC